MKPFLTAMLLTVGVALLAFAWTDPATASEPSPELLEVQSRIEARVDQRLHSILDGFLADAG